MPDKQVYYLYWEGDCFYAYEVYTVFSTRELAEREIEKIKKEEVEIRVESGQSEAEAFEEVENEYSEYRIGEYALITE